MLTIVALGASFVHGRLLRSDRLARMDIQIRDAANNLLDTDLDRTENKDFERIDNLLTAQLGDARIGKLFALRDADGKVIFQSTGAKLLSFQDLPVNPEWVTLYQNGKLVRLLNVHFQGARARTLQVGLVMDNSIIAPAFFSQGNLFFGAFIILLGTVAAWTLTSTLLRPISQLVQFISGISPESGIAIPPLPRELDRLKRGSKESDELRGLLDSFSALTERVNRSYKLSRVWSYQMAHELKTPLAIMEGEIALARKKGVLPSDLADSLLCEVMASSEIVTDFLTWAELEGASAKKNLYANSVRSVLTGLQRRFSNKFSGRLELKIENDFYVLANSQHLENLLANLISNALIYSPESEKVTVSTPAPNTLCISDCGPGIPAQVLERYGEPFNRAESVKKSHTKGNGLGLAYVQSVCRLYLWDVEVASHGKGTDVILRFPSSADEFVAEARPASEVVAPALAP